jgi:hypothetical protein
MEVDKTFERLLNLYFIVHRNLKSQHNITTTIIVFPEI